MAKSYAPALVTTATATALAIAATFGSATEASAQSMTKADKANVIEIFRQCGGSLTSRGIKTEPCLRALTEITKSFAKRFAGRVIAADRFSPNQTLVATRCTLGLQSELDQGNLASRPNQVIENVVQCLNAVNRMRLDTGIQPADQTTYSFLASLVECARGNQSYCRDLQAFWQRNERALKI